VTFFAPPSTPFGALIAIYGLFADPRCGREVTDLFGTTRARPAG
jgi:hypothetical protein